MKVNNYTSVFTFTHIEKSKKPFDTKTTQAASGHIAPAKAEKGIEKGRVENDPRKSIILKKSIIGSIIRCVMKIIGQGSKVKEMKQAAAELTIKESKGIIESYTNQKKRPISDHTINVEDVHIGTVPDGLKESQELVDAGKSLSSKNVAAAHLETKNYASGLKPLASGDGTAWNPIRVKIENGQPIIMEESVSPTTERAMKVADDLNNIYYNISTSGHISISCGVINTEEKAEQFMGAVAHAMKVRKEMGLPEQPLRISMHQLNAMGLPGIGESSLIKKQKKMVDYIEQNIEKFVPGITHPVIAHVNQCMNGFTNVPGENHKSHELNLSGLAVQAQWTAEDEDIVGVNCSHVRKVEDDIREKKAVLAQQHELLRQKHPDLGRNDRAIKILNSDIEILKDNIRTSDSVEEIAKWESELKALNEQLKNLYRARKSILSTEKQISQKIEELEGGIKGSEKELKTALKALTLEFKQRNENKNNVKLEAAMRLLANQLEMEKELGLKPLSPAELMGVQLLLDRMLGTVTEINCKSGLDRTGFVRAFTKAIESLPSDKAMEFLLNFENRAQELDAAMLKEYKEKGNDFNMRAFLQRNPQFKEVADFQGRVFAELRGVGFEITARSTGVPGFKWHHDKSGINPFEKNLHPMPYLPLLIYDPKERDWVQMKAKGKLTDGGNAVLMGLSKRRGG